MKALFKTLFGDLTNMAFVALVLGLELLLIRTGHTRDAAFAIPLIILAGMAWLASR